MTESNEFQPDFAKGEGLLGTSVRVTGAPPVTETFFNCSSAQYPSDCPSAEKNGPRASDSVPGTWMACNCSRGRNHRLLFAA